MMKEKGIAGYRWSFDKFGGIFLPIANVKKVNYVKNYHRSVYVGGVWGGEEEKEMGHGDQLIYLCVKEQLKPGEVKMTLDWIYSSDRMALEKLFPTLIHSYPIKMEGDTDKFRKKASAPHTKKSSLPPTHTNHGKFIGVYSTDCTKAPCFQRTIFPI